MSRGAAETFDKLKKEHGDPFVQKLPRGLTQKHFEGIKMTESVRHFMRRNRRVEETRIVEEISQLLSKVSADGSGALAQRLQHCIA